MKNDDSKRQFANSSPDEFDENLLTGFCLGCKVFCVEVSFAGKSHTRFLEGAYLDLRLSTRLLLRDSAVIV